MINRMWRHNSGGVCKSGELLHNIPPAVFALRLPDVVELDPGTNREPQLSFTLVIGFLCFWNYLQTLAIFHKLHLYHRPSYLPVWFMWQQHILPAYIFLWPVANCNSNWTWNLFRVNRLVQQPQIWGQIKMSRWLAGHLNTLSGVSVLCHDDTSLEI